MSSGDTQGQKLIEQGILDLVRFRGDPAGAASAAIERDPEFQMAHLFRAHMMAFAMQPSLASHAQKSLNAAKLAGQSGEREAIHIKALESWLAGRFEQAKDVFSTLLDRFPGDLLGLAMAHQADFFTGDRQGLLNRPNLVLEHYGDNVPGRAAVLSMLAFGLEENDRLDEAFDTTLAALEIDHQDCWAIHAGGHVFEMAGRIEDGISWYQKRHKDWADDSFFIVHNAWHWGLLHLERLEADAALAIYDRYLAPEKRSIVLNLCDAASFLWRLRLLGFETNGREIDLWTYAQRHLEDGHHVFNDVHMMLAAIMVDDNDGIDRLIQTSKRQSESAAQEGNALMLKRAGIPIMLALKHYHDSKFDRCADGLSSLGNDLFMMGGSTAQRDVVWLTMIDAMIRAGQNIQVSALLHERVNQRVESVLAPAWLRRVN